MIFGGINSTSTIEDKIEEDFQSLIEGIYNDSNNQDEIYQLVSKELYADDHKLNAKIVFRFKDKSALSSKDLSELLVVHVDANGDYIAGPGKKEEFVKGNGKLIQQGSQVMMKWPKTAGKIEIETRGARSKDSKVTSLFSRWVQWKEFNLRRQSKSK